MVPDLAARLSEFRSALVVDETFVGCGNTWKVACRTLICGRELRVDNAAVVVPPNVRFEIRQRPSRNPRCSRLSA